MKWVHTQVGEGVKLRVCGKRQMGTGTKRGIESIQKSVPDGAAFAIEGHINTGSRAPHLSLHMFTYRRWVRIACFRSAYPRASVGKTVICSVPWRAAEPKAATPYNEHRNAHSQRVHLSNVKIPYAPLNCLTSFCFRRATSASRPIALFARRGRKIVASVHIRRLDF